MGLAKTKQIEIVNKSKEIESALCKKYKKIDEGLTFGGKMKSIQEKMNNPFLTDAIWSIIRLRNHIVHENEHKVTLKEYEHFLNLYKYVMNILP